MEILHRNYFPYYIPRGFTNLTKWDYKKYPDTIGITVTSIDSREPEFAWRKLINKIVKSSWGFMKLWISWNCLFQKQLVITFPNLDFISTLLTYPFLLLWQFLWENPLPVHDLFSPIKIRALEWLGILIRSEPYKIQNFSQKST